MRQIGRAVRGGPLPRGDARQRARIDGEATFDENEQQWRWLGFEQRRELDEAADSLGLGKESAKRGDGIYRGGTNTQILENRELARWDFIPG